MKAKISFVKIASLIALLATACDAAFADVPTALKLPAVIDSNMVLQRGQSVPIWGWAAPGTKVSVQFGNQTKTATADSDGKWIVRLRSLPANAEPASMTITAGNTLVLTNILVGEVWLCSGQSNMEKPIGANAGQHPTVNAPEEMATGDKFPQIRLFKVAKIKSATPLPDVKVAHNWMVCSSNALEKTKFTAVGYFFGRKISRDVNVPVGLIESSWGGTMIEPWTPLDAYTSVPKLADLAKIPAGETNFSRERAAVIYNAMIVPLAPYAIRGALWYQGEGNVRNTEASKLYTDKMEAMISSWRKLWNEGNFSFYYVQLAPFNYAVRTNSLGGVNNGTLAEMWEAQTLALKVPKTGMAVVTDTVDNFHDIHPTRKVEVGERLALIALANDYGKKVESSGPTFKSVRFAKGKATVSFKHVDGLTTRDGKSPNWFQIAGADGKFVDADAALDGEKVIVSSSSVADPKFVRLGWNELAEPNLTNAAGLPARSFTTAKW